MRASSACTSKGSVSLNRTWNNHGLAGCCGLCLRKLRLTCTRQKMSICWRCSRHSRDPSLVARYCPRPSLSALHCPWRADGQHTRCLFVAHVGSYGLDAYAMIQVCKADRFPCDVGYSLEEARKQQGVRFGSVGIDQNICVCVNACNVSWSCASAAHVRSMCQDSYVSLVCCSSV